MTDLRSARGRLEYEQSKPRPWYARYVEADRRRKAWKVVAVVLAAATVALTVKEILL